MVETYYNYSNKELIRKLGQKLKELRLEANLSQAELAHKTGMGRTSIAEIEKGRNFSMESLISILRVLNKLNKLEYFLKKEKHELSPMEIYEIEKKKRKKGGYNI